MTSTTTDLDVSGAATSRGGFLVEVQVEELFGRYSYRLSHKDRKADSGDFYSRLLILYGDNGSGKTTLLRLIFNLLSAAPRRNHRTALLRIPFRRFEVTLSSGCVVGATRAEKVTGPYTLYLKRPGRRDFSTEIRLDGNGVVRDTPGVSRFERLLTRLDLTLFYLTDERELVSDAIPKRRIDRPNHDVLDAEAMEARRPRDATSGHFGKSGIDQALHSAIELALSWARSQAIRGSQQGEADANTIFTRIIDALASSERPTHTSGASIAQLRLTLEAQAARSSDFAAFGLPSGANVQQLLDALGRVSHNIDAVVAVTEPYIDGLRARLDALQAVQQAMASFVETVNAFFGDKSVSFNLATGLMIDSPGPHSASHLKPTMLSSGEKQLLLLFCNTLIAGPNTTVFLIDEPELSLNIKWQRHLISSLATAAGGRPVQFCLATHSFELFAPHSDNVWRLQSFSAVHDGDTRKA